MGCVFVGDWRRVIERVTDQPYLETQHRLSKSSNSWDTLRSKYKRWASYNYSTAFCLSFLICEQECLFPLTLLFQRHDDRVLQSLQIRISSLWRLRGLHVMGKELGINWLLEAQYWACLNRMIDGLNEQIKYHVLPSNPTFLYSLLCSINISRSLLYVRYCVWHWKASNKNLTLKNKKQEIKNRNKKHTSLFP